MNNKSVLIVEDEVLIANQMKIWLNKNNVTKVDVSIGYNDAILNLKSRVYDLVLLDIQLYGNETGIGIAKWINENLKIPFIFLTSYSDEETLNEVKKVNPIGFINKPIREVNFSMMINLHLDKQKKRILKFETKTKTFTFNLSEIRYLQSEHVYLKIYFSDYTEQLLRCSLSKFLALVPDNVIVQINRSVAINPSFITEKSETNLSLNRNIFTISPNFKENLNSF